MNARIAIVMALMQLSASVITIGQQRHITLPELVKRFGPRPIYQERQVELLPDTLEELIPKTDLLLHGRVESYQTYLSSDEVELYTDYVISPIAIGTRRDALSLKVSNLTPPVTVVRWGGEMMIDNVQVKLVHGQLRYFTVGEELLLFLGYNEMLGKHVIVGGGHFVVKDGTIHPLFRHPRHFIFGGMAVSQLSAEIARSTAKP
jgi:hypothetical protein